MQNLFNISPRASMQNYLCIVTASWHDPSSETKTGIFAQTLNMDIGREIESIARLTVGLMESSGLPLSPAHVVVVKNDQVVANWMAGRDFLASDVFDAVEVLLKQMRGGAHRRETLA